MPVREIKTTLAVDGEKAFNKAITESGRNMRVIASEMKAAAADFNLTGDEMESGQVLLFVRDDNLPLEQVVAAHKSNMEKLLARRREYDYICPAHNGTMLQPDLYLKDFIALDQSILDGTARVQPDTAGFGYAPYQVGDSLFAQMGAQERAEYGQASIVYLKKEG